LDPERAAAHGEAAAAVARGDGRIGVGHAVSRDVRELGIQEAERSEHGLGGRVHVGGAGAGRHGDEIGEARPSRRALVYLAPSRSSAWMLPGPRISRMACWTAASARWVAWTLSL